MTIWNAIRELKQLVRELKIRLERVERREGKFITDGWTPSDTAPVTDEVIINIEKTKFVDNDGHESVLKPVMYWDETEQQWKFYAIFRPCGE